MIKELASCRVQIRSISEGKSPVRRRVGSRGLRSTVYDRRDQSYRILPGDTNLLSSDGRRSNHDLCFVLKSPMMMDFGVMGRRRKGSMGEFGSVYAAVTVQLSIMLMVTLSREQEKLSMRSTILFATYSQTRGGGEPGEASENNK